MIQTNYLVYQAKSFYNAYIALVQIHEDCEDKMLYSVPVMVYGAFSIEITLKAILAKNGIDYGKEHNLLVLYQMLPKPFGIELLGHLYEKAPEYRETDKCAEELVLISNAFVDWRYAFEGNPAPALSSRFLAAFAYAAIYTMFSHYNVDLVPATNTKTDEEIEEMFCQNRETCIQTNLSKIQKSKKNGKKQ